LLTFIDDAHPTLSESAVNEVGPDPLRKRRLGWAGRIVYRLDAQPKGGGPFSTDVAGLDVVGHLGGASVESAPQLFLS
jgi:hypothetical protein